ncbi:MAG: MMPL family transporter, partial [Bacteroidetes bacterium]|nr:MMPL family transporter [Bacteroidota bacterium]
MDSHESNQEAKKSFSFDYDKYYKVLLIIPVILLLGSSAYLTFFYITTGDIVNKDVTLSGGVTLTVFDPNISIQELRTALEPKFDDLVLRKLTNFLTGEQVAVTIETPSEAEEIQKATEEFLNYELTTDNSSMEFTGSSLSNSFYKQLLVSILIAFIFMVIVVFIIFRSVLPSIYVVLSALMDIIVPLAIINLAGIRISTAGVAAFLMLIGYSVDTDILLTTRVLKRREEPLNQRIFGAFKTGLTMTLTSLAAVLVAYFLVISPVLKQVFLVLSIGLVVDLASTWLMNASL